LLTREIRKQTIMKTITKLSITFILSLIIFRSMQGSKQTSLRDEMKLILKMYKNENDNEMLSNYEKQGMCLKIYKKYK